MRWSELFLFIALLACLITCTAALDLAESYSTKCVAEAH